MSINRAFSPILSSTTRSTLTASLKSRYRPSSTRNTQLNYLPSICLTCVRRTLQTATPYRPTNLDIPNLDPSPPRNKNAPKNELTQGRLDERRPPPFSSTPVDASLQVQQRDLQRQAKESIQPLPKATQSPQPKPITSEIPLAAPVTAAKLTTTTTTPATPRKLRPRKAAMTLTPLAVSHIRNLTEQTPPKLIRVGVKNRGCSGLAYNLEYISQPGKFDEVVEQDGAKVYIDSKALFSIIGSEMDWVEDKLSARFVFKNPNIKEQCGCGESFMV